MSTAVTILDCFDNLIGMKGACDYVPPKSGYHLADIGISERMVNDIITEQYRDSTEFFLEKKNFALNLIATRFNSKFSNRYKSMTLVEGKRIGQYKENLKWIATTAGELIGQRWTLNNTDSFLDYFLSRIEIQIDQSKDIDIEFYDLQQNDLLHTTTIGAVANKVVPVFPHLTFSSPRKKLDLLMVYDPDGASYVDGNYTGSHDSNCGGCIGEFSGPYVKVQTVKINSASAKVAENLTTIPGTAGLSSIYSVSCNHKDWLCSNSQAIALPLLLLTGFEILDFALKDSGNERLNNVTWFNKEATEKASNDLLKRFEAELYNMMQYINLPDDKKCFTCKQPYMIKTAADF